MRRVLEKAGLVVLRQSGSLFTGHPDSRPVEGIVSVEWLPEDGDYLAPQAQAGGLSSTGQIQR